MSQTHYVKKALGNKFNAYVFIPAGSIYEAKSRSGISHLLEHLLFRKGDPSKFKGDLLSKLSAIGKFNGSTYSDFTMYAIESTSKHALQAVKALLEVVLKTEFNQSMLNRERAIVKEEMRMMYNSGIEASHFSIFLRLNHHTPYSNSIIGRIETLDAITVNDIQAYYQQHYTSPIVILHGPESLKAKCETVVKAELNAFQKQHNGRAYNSTFDIIGSKVHAHPPKQIEMYLISPSDAPVSSVVLGFKGCPYAHEDTMCLQLIAHALHTNIFNQLRGIRSLVYHTSTKSMTYQHAASLSVKFLTSQDEKIPEILQIIVQELKHMCSTITKAEFEHHMSGFTVTIDNMMTDPYLQCVKLGKDLLYAGKDMSTIHRDQISALTVDVFKKTASKYLKAEAAVAVGYVRRQKAHGSGMRLKRRLENIVAKQLSKLAINKKYSNQV
jgi:predicted Zn-dependent peptidase